MPTLAPRTEAPFRPAAAFEVIDNPTRKRLLEVLLQRGPLHSLLLADELELSTLKLNHHLQLLKEAGLVRLRVVQDGQVATFSPIGWGRLKRKWEDGLTGHVGLAVVR